MFFILEQRSKDKTKGDYTISKLKDKLRQEHNIGNYRIVHRWVKCLEKNKIITTYRKENDNGKYIKFNENTIAHLCNEKSKQVTNDILKSGIISKSKFQKKVHKSVDEIFNLN